MFTTKDGKTVSKAGISGFRGRRIPKDTVEGIIDNLGDTNLIELSEGQGITEDVLGQLMDKLVREEVFIITETKKRTAKTFENQVNKSLEKLRTDYIDLYELENVKKGYDYLTVVGQGGALEKAVELKKSGKIRYIGVSTYDSQIAQEFNDHPYVDKIMVPYNPSEIHNKDLYKKFSTKTFLVGISPSGGRLSDNKEGLVNFSMKEDFLAHVIFRVKNKEEIKELNQIISSNDQMTAEEEEALIKEYEDYGCNYCRQCGGCIPCTVGIDIIRNLAINTRLKRGDYSVLDGYFDQFKTAHDCIKCGACDLRCPYLVPVRDFHKETRALVDEYEKKNQKEQ